tara:strand:- start:4163 stop:4843 length:681 start_codon:yes stop_codon:yes gene_type:complete
LNIITIIPARGGSKGIPKKNLIEVGGNPLLYYSITQSLKSMSNKTYVSSDCDEIGDYSKSLGASFMKRPLSISKDTSTSESCLLHTLQSIKEKIDIVVFLQATSPLRTSFDIDRGIKKLINNNYDSVFSVVQGGDLFLWEETPSKDLFGVNHDYKSRKRRQESNNLFIENGSIYIFKPEVLYNFNNRIGGRFGYFMMDSWKQYEIDTEEDIEIIEYYLNKYKLWKE